MCKNYLSITWRVLIALAVWLLWRQIIGGSNYLYDWQYDLLSLGMIIVIFCCYLPLKWRSFSWFIRLNFANFCLFHAILLVLIVDLVLLIFAKEYVSNLWAFLGQAIVLAGAWLGGFIKGRRVAELNGWLWLVLGLTVGGFYVIAALMELPTEKTYCSPRKSPYLYAQAIPVGITEKIIPDHAENIKIDYNAGIRGVIISFEYQIDPERMEQFLLEQNYTLKNSQWYDNAGLVVLDYTIGERLVIGHYAIY